MFYKMLREFNYNYKKQADFREFCKLLRIKETTNDYAQMKSARDAWVKSGCVWFTK